MPAAKRARMPHKSHKKAAAKKKSSRSSRWNDYQCKGTGKSTCRIRTKGMKKGVRYRRITPDGKQIVIRVVGHV